MLKKLEDSVGALNTSSPLWVRQCRQAIQFQAETGLYCF